MRQSTRSVQARMHGCGAFERGLDATVLNAAMQILQIHTIRRSATELGSYWTINGPIPCIKEHLDHR